MKNIYKHKFHPYFKISMNMTLIERFIVCQTFFLIIIIRYGNVNKNNLTNAVTNISLFENYIGSF